MKYKVITLLFALFIALLIAYKYAYIEVSSDTYNYVQGIWHGINAPINALIILFTNRVIRAQACGESYQIAWLISALISIWAWINYLSYVFLAPKRKKAN